MLLLAFASAVPSVVGAPAVAPQSIVSLGRGLSPYETIFKSIAGDLWIERSAQAWAESEYNPSAKSPVGAVGMTQFMPRTWEQWRPSASALPSDPWASVFAQHGYMNYLIKMFAGDRDKARAAYNCGEGNVLRAIRRSKQVGMKDSQGWLRALPLITGPHAKETQDYVVRIEKRVQWITAYGRGGPWTGPRRSS
jgi:membrane-bound lytic murein transglycosylase MltF